MKIRNSFVTNSSSSSFVVSRRDVTPLQQYAIKNHVEVAKYLELNLWPEPWTIILTNQTIEGHTPMDNFDMEIFLVEIGVDIAKVEFSQF